jgi:DNA-binding transcriptional LysR family regulator
MQRSNLAAVDLNLLVVFDAVMAERSVTRAALRLRLTQPAVSHAVSRLRALFRDPLFVRTPAGMEPTPLALGLGPRIGAVLNEIGAILAPGRDFDPATSDRTFTVGMSDYAAAVFLPGLARRVETTAPGITLVARHTSHAAGVETLDSDEAELVVGNFPDPPRRLDSELLYREGFMCALRAGHPALARGFDLDATCAARTSTCRWAVSRPGMSIASWPGRAAAGAWRSPPGISWSHPTSPPPRTSSPPSRNACSGPRRAGSASSCGRRRSGYRRSRSCRCGRDA